MRNEKDVRVIIKNVPVSLKDEVVKMVEKPEYHVWFGFTLRKVDSVMYSYNPVWGMWVAIDQKHNCFDDYYEFDIARMPFDAAFELNKKLWDEHFIQTEFKEVY